MAKIFNSPFVETFDGNGVPQAGALLYFYITGTTTPKNTYSDPDLAIGHLNPNPVPADANGLFGPIYLAQDVDYKCILKTSAQVTVATRDPLLVINTSVIAHQGSLIVGNASGADSELLISATNGAALRSDGTTAVWRSPNYTKQVFLSGSGTYTTPTNCTAIKIYVQAGGGGGGGTGGTTGPTGTTGGTSSFNSVTAVGGSGGVGTAGSTQGAGGVGGTGGTGTASFRIPGQAGGSIFFNGGTGNVSGPGGGSHTGPGGAIFSGTAATAGAVAPTNAGGGGGGSISPGVTACGGGGGGGEYFELHILTPSATYTYAVGAGGAGGIGTGSGLAIGGAGAAGIVRIEEMYW